MPPLTAARRPVDALDRANRTAELADAVVRSAWRQLLGALRSAPSFADARRAAATARHVLHAVPHGLRALLARRLTSLAAWGHAAAVRATLDRLPVRVKRRALARRLGLPLREADALDRLMRELVFPPPDPAEVRAAVFATGYEQAIGQMTRLLAPDDLAAEVYGSVAAGLSVTELAKRVQPKLDGLRTTARRVARDASMHVAHAMQFRAWAAVDDDIIGYQIIAVDNGHSPTSRPEHRARHGTVYHKQPGPGQRGLDEMPRPPFEADGRLAFNCRCLLVPVFKG